MTSIYISIIWGTVTSGPDVECINISLNMSQQIWFVWTIYKIVMKSIIHSMAFGMMVLFLWIYFHQAQAVLWIALNYLSSTYGILILLQTSEAEKMLITKYAGKHRSPKQSLKCILQMVSLFTISTRKTAHRTAGTDTLFSCMFMQPKVIDTQHTDFTYRWYGKCSSNVYSYKCRSIKDQKH